MKIKFLLPVLLLTVFTVSCASTGEYLPLSKDETVIGTAQTAFTVQSSFFSMKQVRDAVNTEAYIRLLGAAERKYPNGGIDIRDIVWVTGRQVDPQNTEIIAAGKVIQIK